MLVVIIDNAKKLLCGIPVFSHLPIRKFLEGAIQLLLKEQVVYQCNCGSSSSGSRDSSIMAAIAATAAVAAAVVAAAAAVAEIAV